MVERSRNVLAFSAEAELLAERSRDQPDSRFEPADPLLSLSGFAGSSKCRCRPKS